VVEATVARLRLPRIPQLLIGGDRPGGPGVHPRTGGGAGEYLADAAFVLLILSTLVLLGSSRLRFGIRVLAFQGWVVGAAALLLPNHHVTVRVVVIVVIATVLDTVVFPILLLRALRTARVQREDRPPVGYTRVDPDRRRAAGGVPVGREVREHPAAARRANPLELPVAAFTILAGLFMIVSR